MSEAKEAPKKKGKLPLILVLLLVLGGGGFFGMKMRGGGEKKEPEIKLGAIEPLEEFLVNLRTPSSYARVEIGLHMKEGFDKKLFTDSTPAVRDTIITILSSKTLDEVSSVAGKDKLRKEIAASLNEKLTALDPKAEKDDKDKKKKKKDEEEEEEEEEPENPDWDSQTGPVLKVYFTNFATQQG